MAVNVFKKESRSWFKQKNRSWFKFVQLVTQWCSVPWWWSFKGIVSAEGIKMQKLNCRQVLSWCQKRNPWFLQTTTAWQDSDVTSHSTDHIWNPLQCKNCKTEKKNLSENCGGSMQEGFCWASHLDKVLTTDPLIFGNTQSSVQSRTF